MTQKNAFVLVVDSLRYDVVSDDAALKFIAPNLHRMVARSLVARTVTNAQSTQFVMPALFTCTYPLDYGGYNDGIRDRPKSFVEVFREAGYETRLLATANQLGLSLGYQRGFDIIGTTSDYRTQVEHRISRTMNYDLERFRRGEIREDEAIARIRALMEPLLDGLIDSIKHHNRSIWPKALETLNQHIAERCMAEKALLVSNPKAVLTKLIQIAPGLYWRYLGRERVGGVGFLLHRALTGISWRTRSWVSTQTLFPFLVLQHYQIIAGDVVNAMIEAVERKQDKPWLVHVHLMDLHDCRAVNRIGHVFGLLRFLPKWIIARLRGQSGRRFLYDSTLMYIDRILGRFLRTLEQQIEAGETVLLVTGDHGSCYAQSPRAKPYIGERMFREDLEVPLILAGSGKSQPVAGDFTDSMGVTRTLLDTLNMQPHQSFKSFPLSSRERDAVISESCGRGYAELQNGELYFTVTTRTHRGFFKVIGDRLHATRLFDLRRDDRELDNVVADERQNAVLQELSAMLWRERGELLDSRRVAKTSPPAITPASA